MARRLVVDAPRQRLVTVGDDKTVRLWQLPEGRLIKVLRLPIGERQEGRPFALAISPDGKTVVVGGWTGWEWDEKASVYLFDVESGEIVRRIGELPEAVSTLNIAPDGKTLAIGLNGPSGVRFFRLVDGVAVAADSQFNDRVMAADYAVDGRLALVSLDGFVRVYDASSRLIGRQALGPGAQPAGIRFSPDGSRLGISFRDRARGTVLSSRDFSVLGETKSAGVPDGAVFAQVAWSSDGKRLLITGDSGSAGDGRIWSWSEGGLGSMQSHSVSQGRVADMAAMADGAIAYSTEDPAIGVLAADGRRTVFVAAPIANFRGSGEALRVSADGAVVEFPLRGKQARFSLAERKLETGRPAQADLLPARILDPGVTIERWRDSEGTRMNGHPLALDAYETSRSYAISPEGAGLVLGTEWALRLFDLKARQLWATPIASPAWNVSFSGNGQLVIAALGDGTIRWYRREDGEEVMALFPHGDGQEWIAWVPSGYYVSSDFGDNFVGWLLNRGKDKAPDFFRAVQFERLLYRPDIVQAKFAARGADIKLATGEKQFDISQLAGILPPRVRISTSERNGNLQLSFTAEGSALPLESFAVYINNIPMLPAVQRLARADEHSILKRVLEFPVFEKGNVVRVEVFSGQAIGLAEQWVSTTTVQTRRREIGDLYLLAVGVNEFENLKNVDLLFAARDAEQVGKRFASETGRRFKNTYIKVLSDLTANKPLRANVISALDFFKVAKAEDTVVIFLASHGVSDAAGNYFFVPRDAQLDDTKNLDKLKPEDVKSMIGWSVFFDALRSAAGRRVLIVDTCHSGDIAGTVDLHSLSKRSAASLFSLVSASKGSEYSQEYDVMQHGLFTYAMLEAMNSPSTDINRDGVISISEMFAGIAALVEKLRHPTLPQTPQKMTPDPLGEIALVSIPNDKLPSNTVPASENLGCGTRSLDSGRQNSDCVANSR